MVLNSRNIRIVNYLLMNQGQGTINGLMDKFKISKRTLYYDLGKINYWLKSIGVGEIEVVSGKFTLDMGEKKTILKAIPHYEENSYEFSKEERKAIIALNIFLGNMSITIDKLTELLKVSRNTVVADMNRLRNDLGRKSLQLKHRVKIGYYIKGREALGVDVFIGRGKMLTSHMVTVNGKTKLQGKHILIATGSSPRIVNIAGIDQIKYYTNETIFTIPKLPKQLAVIGGGPIGCEIAQAFANMGAEVTIIEYTGSILNREDEEVKEYMTGLLSRDINILTNASVTQFKPLGDGINIQLQQGQQERELMVDSVFLAAGRKNAHGAVVERLAVLFDRELKNKLQILKI